MDFKNWTTGTGKSIAAGANLFVSATMLEAPHGQAMHDGTACCSCRPAGQQWKVLSGDKSEPQQSLTRAVVHAPPYMNATLNTTIEFTTLAASFNLVSATHEDLFLGLFCKRMKPCTVGPHLLQTGHSPCRRPHLLFASSEC